VLASSVLQITRLSVPVLLQVTYVYAQNVHYFVIRIPIHNFSTTDKISIHQLINKWASG